MRNRGTMTMVLHSIALTLAAWSWNVKAHADTSVDNEEKAGQNEWQEDWEDESDSVGFADNSGDEVKDDVKNDVDDEAKHETAPSRWALTGFARSDWGLWVERFDRDENPFAKGRQSLDLDLRYQWEFLRFKVSGHLEYDLAYLHKRDSYNEPTLDTYEWLVDFRETYISASFDFFDLTTGWQIVVWGEGDVLSLLDVATPKDLREPGLADLDDLRLPVLATRLSLFSGYHRIEAMIIHESFFGYKSPPFGPFSPLSGLLGNAPSDAAFATDYILNYPIWYEDEQVRFSINNQQYLMRWSYRGPGIDLALYLASVLDQQGVLGSDFLHIYTKIIEEKDVNIILDHQRYMMVGHSGAWPFGSWLFKWELGIDIDRKYNEDIDSGYILDIGSDTPGEAVIPIVQATQIGGMASIAYMGFRDAMIFIELAKRWLLEDLPDLLFPVEEPIVAVRYTHALLPDDLELELGLSLFGWSVKYGWLARAMATYNIMDGLKVSLGYITYQPGENRFGMLAGFVENDRVFLRLRWDFAIH
ncbi:MAG: hypothetical protein GY847_17235 [Proteobacteria bacterium]|nr:hypothetical protein [Pseudomonadota bacterium]